MLGERALVQTVCSELFKLQDKGYKSMTLNSAAYGISTFVKGFQQTQSK